MVVGMQVARTYQGARQGEILSGGEESVNSKKGDI